MLDKNKTYTYEELKEIIHKAEKEVIKKLDDDLEKINDEKELNPMTSLVVSLNNMIAINEMTSVLLGAENNE